MSNRALPNLPLLEKISNTDDLRKLAVAQLPELCQELRDYIVDCVSKTAGHLASSLAVVELTTALHYVYNTPKDKIVWDVGHQSYPHKILTGHKEELKTIRQKNGLHAFIWRGETEYDLLTTGHASTSIGSALGLAIAEKQLGTKNKVVAVIGDGSLSGGEAYEAMNFAGTTEDTDLTVILNDNEMSISDSVGSIAQYLASIISNPTYVKLVKGGKKVLEKLPSIHEIASKAQEHAKGMFTPGTLFEELGFNYIGPIDGHDISNLVKILQNVKQLGGLQLVHIVTKKGKGYAPAEKEPTKYHGVPAFDPETGIALNQNTGKTSFSQGFGDWLCDLAAIDKKVMGITPAMRIGSGMLDFSKKFKGQFFDVGIAEQNSMVLASGLAAGGLYPVVNIYSTFLQRAYDGLISDMAIQNLPMLLAIDRGGIVGPDGATHQGMFDIAYTRCIPNLTIMTPSDLKEQYLMLNTAYKLQSPCVVRYERNQDTSLDKRPSLDETLEIGKGRILNQGKKIALLCFGSIAKRMQKLCVNENYTLADMRFIKPLDTALICKLAQEHDYLLTLEEGVIQGGIGQEVALIALKANPKLKLQNLGFNDSFIQEGTRDELLTEQGLDESSVKESIKNLIEE